MDNYKNKLIGVLGLGLSGQSAIKYLTNKYINSIKIIKFSEVLSTEESRSLYSEIRKSEYNIGKKENLDDLSASIILQSWFNENMIT